jgi:hypothetical protein
MTETGWNIAEEWSSDRKAMVAGGQNQGQKPPPRGSGHGDRDTYLG